MKKVFLILAVASFFAACGGRGAETPTATATGTQSEEVVEVTSSTTTEEAPAV